MKEIKQHLLLHYQILLIYSKWKAQIEKEQPYQEFEFEIKCKKCKRKNVIIDKEDSIGCSEYTGTWGSADAVIKCLECGNAFSIKIADCN